MLCSICYAYIVFKSKFSSLIRCFAKCIFKSFDEIHYVMFTKKILTLNLKSTCLRD